MKESRSATAWPLAICVILLAAAIGLYLSERNKTIALEEELRRSATLLEEKSSLVSGLTSELSRREMELNDLSQETERMRRSGFYVYDIRMDLLVPIESRGPGAVMLVAGWIKLIGPEREVMFVNPSLAGEVVFDSSLGTAVHFELEALDPMSLMGTPMKNLSEFIWIQDSFERLLEAAGAKVSEEKLGLGLKVNGVALGDHSLIEADHLPDGVRMFDARSIFEGIDDVYVSALTKKSQTPVDF